MCLPECLPARILGPPARGEPITFPCPKPAIFAATAAEPPNPSDPRHPPLRDLENRP